MPINYINGIRLHRSVTAGLHRVVSRQEYLNKINVFPVPDGDTGTNMAYTLTTIEEGIRDKAYKDIKRMSMAIADSALDGARGNSGAILAQFFVGFADGIKEKVSLTAKDFAQAAIHAKDYAYDALTHPREGTMLSVIKAWSESLLESCNNSNDILSMLSKGLDVAQLSLKNTPKQLDVLAKAGVLDAGAQGFVDMLEGINEYITSGKIAESDLEVIDQENENIDFVTNEKYRYCTECIILGKEIHRRKLQEKLLDFGNSIVLAGTKNKVKVHIHSDVPREVFSICSEYGTISGEKTDDMIKQQSDAHKKHSPMAVIVDSGCDLPEDIIESLNIHVIPVKLNFGDVHYVDKVSLTSKEFWKEMKSNPIHPQTSQPSPGDFRRQYQFLSSHYDSAISIHIPKKLSGTYQSAVTASKTVSNFQLEVKDCINGSIGMGLIAMRVAEAVQKGKNYEEVSKILDDSIKNTKIYIGFNKLDNAVKGGRISPTLKEITNFLRINPIITFKEDGIKPIGITFGRKNKPDKFKRFVESKIPKNNNFRIGIAHTNMEKFASKWAKNLRNQYGKENVVLTDVGPALGVHAGPNSLIFAIQTYDK